MIPFEHVTRVVVPSVPTQNRQSESGLIVSCPALMTTCDALLSLGLNRTKIFPRLITMRALRSRMSGPVSLSSFVMLSCSILISESLEIRTRAPGINVKSSDAPFADRTVSPLRILLLRVTGLKAFRSPFPKTTWPWTESTVAAVARLISLEHPFANTEQSAIETASTGRRISGNSVIRVSVSGCVRPLQDRTDRVEKKAGLQLLASQPGCS